MRPVALAAVLYAVAARADPPPAATPEPSTLPPAAAPAPTPEGHQPGRVVLRRARAAALVAAAGAGCRAFEALSAKWGCDLGAAVDGDGGAPPCDGGACPRCGVDTPAAPRYLA